jgi:hypothetical protein
MTHQITKNGSLAGQTIKLIYTKYKVDSCKKKLHHWPYVATLRGFLVYMKVVSLNNLDNFHKGRFLSV